MQIIILVPLEHQADNGKVKRTAVGLLKRALSRRNPRATFGSHSTAQGIYNSNGATTKAYPTVPAGRHSWFEYVLVSYGVEYGLMLRFSFVLSFFPLLHARHKSQISVLSIVNAVRSLAEGSFAIIFCSPSSHLQTHRPF